MSPTSTSPKTTPPASNSAGWNEVAPGAAVVAGDTQPAPFDPLSVARSVRQALLEVPGVSGISRGRFSEAATYGPGEVVRGIAVRPRADGYDIDVRLVAAYSPALRLMELADEVRRVVRRVAAPANGELVLGVDVAFEDLSVPARE